MNAGKSAREPPFLTSRKPWPLMKFQACPRQWLSRWLCAPSRPSLSCWTSWTGGAEEVRALEQGMFSGAAITATLHASSWEEAFCRPQLQEFRDLRGVAGCRAASWPGIIRVRLPRCGYYDGFTAGGHILFGGVRLVCRGCRLHPHAGASGSTPANHCAPGGD